MHSSEIQYLNWFRCRTFSKRRTFFQNLKKMAKNGKCSMPMKGGAWAYYAIPTNQWHACHGVKLLPDMPSNSPDLNLIENLWSQVKDPKTSKAGLKKSLSQSGWGSPPVHLRICMNQCPNACYLCSKVRADIPSIESSPNINVSFMNNKKITFLPNRTKSFCLDSINYSVHQSINQSIAYSIKLSINQSTNQSINPSSFIVTCTVQVFESIN